MTDGMTAASRAAFVHAEIKMSAYRFRQVLEDHLDPMFGVVACDSEEVPVVDLVNEVLRGIGFELRKVPACGIIKTTEATIMWEIQGFQSVWSWSVVAAAEPHVEATYESEAAAQAAVAQLIESGWWGADELRVVPVGGGECYGPDSDDDITVVMERPL